MILTGFLQVIYRKFKQKETGATGFLLLPPQHQGYEKVIFSTGEIPLSS